MLLAARTVGVLGCALLLAVPGAGQVCVGATGFARSSLRAAGGAAFATHAHSFGVGLTWGGSATFLGLSLGTTHFDGYTGSSIDIAAAIGYEKALDQAARVQLCPAVTVGHRAGPHDSFGGDYFETDVLASLQLGAMAVRSSHFFLNPTIGLGFEYAQQGSTSSGPLAPTTSHGFGALTLGVGAVFANRVTVLPTADLPIGLAGASAAFALTVAMTIGH